MDIDLAQYPMSLFRGYNFRIFPHVSSLAAQYRDPESGTHIPCGFYAKHSTEMFDKQRIGSSFGCFEAPLKRAVQMEVVFERLERNRFFLGLSLNGRTISKIHQWKEIDTHNIPEVIDAVGIQYPNGRNYHYIRLSRSGQESSVDWDAELVLAVEEYNITHHSRAHLSPMESTGLSGDKQQNAVNTSGTPDVGSTL
eukprot:scaffold212_cov404-Prasinococcus_capsulatus_cf.AAC.18